MTIAQQIEHCERVVEHYERNADNPNANIFIHAYCARLDALYNLQINHEQF